MRRLTARTSAGNPYLTRAPMRTHARCGCMLDATDTGLGSPRGAARVAQEREAEKEAARRAASLQAIDRDDLRKAPRKQATLEVPRPHETFWRECADLKALLASAETTVWHQVRATAWPLTRVVGNIVATKEHACSVACQSWWSPLIRHHISLEATTRTSGLE